MRINGINNSFYGNNGKANNQPNFTALKGIKYNDFYPKEYLKEAEAVLAFKKSEPLKKFFEKYDGYAEFSKWFSKDRQQGYALLEINYNINPVSPKKVETIGIIERKTPQNSLPKINESQNSFNKIKNVIKGLFSKTKENKKEKDIPVQQNTKTSSLVTKNIEPQNSARLSLVGSADYIIDAIDNLTEKIQKLKSEDIEKQILFNKKLIEQEKQNAIRLKNIHEEIKDLV